METSSPGGYGSDEGIREYAADVDRRPPHPSTTPDRAPLGRRRRAVALALTLAALLAACGDPETPAAGDGAAAQEAADARPLGPPEAWVDDEAVLVAVVASAKAGAPLPPELAKLPPRVSPVRVAVRALHDHLVGVNGAAADWDALLAALDRLAAGDRTAVDRGALAPLVAAWRKWTPEERAAEAAWAEVYARRLDLLRSPEVIDARTAAAEPKLPRPPAMSPAEASLVAVRVALAAVVTPGEDVPS
jgi:hypothetical protein